MENPDKKRGKEEGRETRWRWDLERFLIKQYENTTANGQLVLQEAVKKEHQMEARK